MKTAGDYLLIRGDAKDLGFLPDGCVQMVCTSPPYLGHRDYGTGRWEGGAPDCDHRGTNARPDHSMEDLTGSRGFQPSTAARATPFREVCGKCGARRVDRQVGLEASPEEFVAALVGAFREVRRVLRDDGTVWINIGESYYAHNGTRGNRADNVAPDRKNPKAISHVHRMKASGIKAKDCLGVPWLLAFALRADGWYLRDPIVWAKAEVDEDENIDGSVMPGSYQDRCTFSYEMIFMLSKRPAYYFDRFGVVSTTGAPLRNVWRINTEPSRLGHFAAMPRELARRCIKLGTSDKGCCPKCRVPWKRIVEKTREATRPGVDTKIAGVNAADLTGNARYEKTTGYRDPRRYVTTYRTLRWEPGCRCGAGDPVPCVVLDNFNGTATTGVVATGLGRQYVGVDLNKKYLAMGRRRLDRPHAPTARRRRRKDDGRHAPTLF